MPNWEFSFAKRHSGVWLWFRQPDGPALSTFPRRAPMYLDLRRAGRCFRDVPLFWLPTYRLSAVGLRAVVDQSAGIGFFHRGIPYSGADSKAAPVSSAVRAALPHCSPRSCDGVLLLNALSL